MTAMAKRNKLCPSCGAKLADGDRTCPSCGTAIAKKGKRSGKSGTRECPVCGAMVSRRAKKCTSCKANLPGTSQKPEVDRKSVV